MCVPVLYFLDPALDLDLVAGLSGLVLDLPCHYRLAVPGLHLALITVSGLALTWTCH